MTECPHQILHPASWKKASGYAIGCPCRRPDRLDRRADRLERAAVFEEKELAGRSGQALQNIVDVWRGLRSPEHIVADPYITDKKDYLANLKGIGEAYRTVMGKHFRHDHGAGGRPHRGRGKGRDRGDGGAACLR